MRFDMLDEYSTVVPFGLGISKQNRVIQSPDIATNTVEPGVIANCVSRLKTVFKFVNALGRANGREVAR